MKADITAIREVLIQYAVGISTGDFDLWMSLWTDDGRQMPPDAPACVGKEQIREKMKIAFDCFNSSVAP